MHDDPVLPPVAAVEDDVVAIGALDRDVVLRRRHDVPARIGARSEDDRVARLRTPDRELHGRHILRHSDLRAGGGRALGIGNRRERERHSRQHRNANHTLRSHAGQLTRGALAGNPAWTSILFSAGDP